MKHNKFTPFFSAILALAMVFSLLVPLSAVANVDETQPFKTAKPNESTMQMKAAIVEQLHLLEGGPVLHEDLQKLSGNTEVAVIVHLSDKPVALEQGIQELAGRKFTSQQAAAVEKQVQAQQIRIKKTMNVKNISHTEGFAYNTVLNGFSTTVKASDLDKLLEIQGVTLIEPDVEVYAFEDSSGSMGGRVSPAMDTSISFLGIEKLWAEGIQGQGIKVAVLDTGIDKDHPDFAGIYKGGKNFIPNSATYSRTRADNDASETSPVERPATAPEFNERGSSFYTSHGTHVAGTIAAIGANPYNVKGVAPKVDLYAYRVLGAYGSGSTSGIIAAIEESVKQEMDVINLSLGGGANSETDGGSFAINNAMMAGTIAVVATGNAGPNRGTMGTPATARLGIAVGNTTNPEANYDSDVHVVVGDYQLSKKVNLMGTTFGVDVATQLAGEFEVVAVPGVGANTDYNGIDVNGKVVLVSRGGIAFVDKIEHARAAGAVAILIHNFAGGTNAPNESGTFLGDAFEFIPAYDLSQTDGEAIRAALKKGQGTVVFSNFNKTMTIGDEVNDSSSRGPSTPNFDIKPDVSAPGTNIMSTIPMYKADFPDATYEEAFARKTGTSMATPHIAGVAALVKQANPDWNAFDVKVALSNSAKLLNTTNYDVMAQGAGRVEAYAAAHPTILAYAMDEAVLNAAGDIGENVKGTVTFGPQSLKDGSISVTKDILVKDMKGNGGDYNVTVDVTKSFGDAQVTVDQSSFSLSGEQLLKVTLTASKNDNVGTGSEMLGYIKVNGEGTEVSLPFAADFSKAIPSGTELKDMAITETDLSFNGDGVKDTALLTFEITGDIKTNYIELWDIMNPSGGEFADGYIGYLHAANALAAGSYKLDIKGDYKPWATSAPKTTIPDGLYTIDFSAETASGNPPLIGDYVGPIVVKSTAGTIEGKVTNTTATGKIIDKYVEYQAELVNYDLGYDINKKLKATFEVLENNTVKSSGEVKLAQDGTFSFDVGPWNKNTDTVKVKYSDAAGNKAEKVLEKDAAEPVTYAVNKTSITLGVDQQEQLIVTETTIQPDGTVIEKDVTTRGTYSSANSKIATVKKGLVTAKAVGKTQVSIQLPGQQPIVVEVEVKAKPQNIVTYSVNKSSLTLGVDQQEQLIVTETTIQPDGTVIEKDVTARGTYSSANSKIATVKEGLVTAKAVGKTQVRVNIPKQEPIYVYLEVTKKAQDIVTYTVDQSNMNLQVGQQHQLKVTEITTKPNGQIINKDITNATKFSVVNSRIATVQKGLVTAKAAGKTQVRVMIPDQEPILVYLEVTEVEQDTVTYSVNKNEFVLTVGQSEQLKVTKTTNKPNGQIITEDVTALGSYNVVNNKVATIKKGLITPLMPGSTQVRIMIPNAETLLVYINVVEEQKDTVTYSVNVSELKLTVGQESQIIVTETTQTPAGQIFTKDITGTTSFSVVNNKIATVKKGIVTALTVGQTQVNVKIPGQPTQFVYLEVAEVPKDIVTYAIDTTNIVLKVGEQQQLTVVETTTKPDGSIAERNVTAETKFKSSHPKVVTLNKGLVTAVGPGISVITVTHPDFTTTVYATVESEVLGDQLQPVEEIYTVN